eukprot:TRINITY_DN1034_c0_g2_i1.p2 TRINITY_DN1034_c0_g2~~TRINITY_DN1034_c0_g2_i1.p2  ORF type:complete len:102 (-),score=13.24 TRINITY_DN1034_c0_g2_i1:276-581(-)
MVPFGDQLQLATSCLCENIEANRRKEELSQTFIDLSNDEDAIRVPSFDQLQEYTDLVCEGTENKIEEDPVSISLSELSSQANTILVPSGDQLLHLIIKWDV